MPIRPASRADRAFVAELSAEAFAPYGDYRELLPRWTDTPGVVSFVADDGGPRGFVMVGFYYGDDARSWVYADVLAIAVVAGQRGRGLGRRLLRRAVRAAEDARASFDVRELRLTVADTNEPALALFRSEEFRPMAGERRRYDGGQRAVRMRRPLDAREARPVSS